MTTTRNDLHVGSTLIRIDGTPWRTVVHWHLDEGGQLLPAGVEVRCYGVERDDEDDFWGGQEGPRHDGPLSFDDGVGSRGVSSDLIGKRIKWGEMLSQHAAKLSQLMAEGAHETRDFHAASADLMAKMSTSARGLTRANDDTYLLVAALYIEALQSPDHRSRPAMYVMERLIEDHGYRGVLEATEESDRVKVRQWITKARKLGHLSESTANTKRKRDAK